MSNSGPGYRYPLDRNIVSTVFQQAIAAEHVSTLQLDASYHSLSGFHVDVDIIMIFKAIVQTGQIFIRCLCFDEVIR
jgi:hypothetical protein